MGRGETGTRDSKVGPGTLFSSVIWDPGPCKRKVGPVTLPKKKKEQIFFIFCIRTIPINPPDNVNIVGEFTLQSKPTMLKSNTAFYFFCKHTFYKNNIDKCLISRNLSLIK